MERIGPYTIERELSRGGMGVVYRARDPQLDRPVAIKVMLLEGFGQDHLDWERFQQEARTTARIRHPNVVGIHSAGVDGGQPYLVLDLIEGGSLHDRIKNRGPLECREAATIARTLADALHHAHLEGILHRDLKPQNVLLEGGKKPVLADFGLSKLLGVERSGFSVTGEVLGSPAYMSPEQAVASQELGVATDVYGVGATLYAMLTGRPPFHEASVMGTLASVVERAPVPPTKLQARLDPELEAICLRCLAKKPNDRYPTASALRAALDAYLVGAPEAGYQAAAPTRKAGKRVTRSLGLILAGALLGWLASSVPGWLEPSTELDAETSWLKRRGLQRFDRGDHQGAEEDWTQVLEVAPHVASIWYDRASARLGRDDFVGALADIDRAESFQPGDPETLHFLRGRVYSASEEDAKAVAALDLAVALRPDDAVFLTQRGIVKERLGDAKGALADYARALELDPRLKGSYHRRSCIYFESGMLDDALLEVEAALGIDSEYPPALGVRGMVRARRGDQEGALEDYDAVLQPTFDEIKEYLCNRAEVYLKLGRWDDAAVDSDLALKGDPEHRDAYVFRAVSRRAQAQLHEGNGRLELARRLYVESRQDFEQGLARTEGEDGHQGLREQIDGLTEAIRRVSSGR